MQLWTFFTSNLIQFHSFSEKRLIRNRNIHTSRKYIPTCTRTWTFAGKKQQSPLFTSAIFEQSREDKPTIIAPTLHWNRPNFRGRGALSPRGNVFERMHIRCLASRQIVELESIFANSPSDTRSTRPTIQSSFEKTFASQHHHCH